MRNPWIGRILVLTSGVFVFALYAPLMMAQQPADIVFHNGKILTVDANFSTAEAVAVRGRQIAAVGTNAQVLALAGPNTQKIDLKGRTVIPGLIDTHSHIHNYAEGAYGSNLGPGQLGTYPVDWRGVNSKDDVPT